MIRVTLPYHLQTLAGTGNAVELDLHGQVTLGQVLDTLEARYPMLCGTIRDHVTRVRRPLIRFIACQTDLSHLPPETSLPEDVCRGLAPLMIIGAIAGG